MFACISHVNSQTCCSGGVPLSNNVGLPILEKGSLQLGLFYDYNNLNTLNQGSQKLDENTRLRITHSVLFNMGYSFTENFGVEALFTWVNQRRNITQLGNSNLDETSGIGDAIVLGKYRVLYDLNYEFTLGLGGKIPLGSTEQRNSQGILLNADLQPGSNAFDVIYFASYARSFNFRKSLTFSSRMTYRATGTNNTYQGSSSYKFGNEFQTFVTFADQLLLFKQIITPSISFKYRNASKDRITGIEIDNTGGNWIFFIPDFTIFLSPNILFSTRVEIPVYSNVDGLQLTPTYRINSGVTFRLAKKKQINITNTQ